MQLALKQGAWLTAVTAALWLLLAGPAWLLAGVRGLEGLSYAAVLCLVPGWLVFLAVGLYGVSNLGIGGVLAGTVGRMAFVLGGVLLFRKLRPDLGLLEFILWLLVFYFVTLAVETGMTLRRPADASLGQG